eukprot:gnl/Trimastix_PCT/3583.p1 GENE.gnl/Trimastix_PCT/3583~~gnl/Trimastix_PCT/3583.p1  ORF type:complete len:325 (-),score=70.11 gnl/Trimastix_PCT/3583:19-849(-)
MCLAFRNKVTSSAPSSLSQEGDHPFPLENWGHYIGQRKWLSAWSTFPDDLQNQIQDGLSRPLTLVAALQHLGLDAPSGSATFYVLGASEGVEEAQLVDRGMGAACWRELSVFLPDVLLGLVLVGPGLSAERDGTVHIASSRLFAAFHRGTAQQFFETTGTASPLASAGLKDLPHLVALFNPGLASLVPRGDPWSDALDALLRLDVPIVVTMVNEHDAQRDAQYLRAHRARFVLEPQPNPFAAGTVLRPREADAETAGVEAWARPNHTWAIVQGTTP